MFGTLSGVEASPRGISEGTELEHCLAESLTRPSALHPGSRTSESVVVLGKFSAKAMPLFSATRKSGGTRCPLFSAARKSGGTRCRTILQSRKGGRLAQSPEGRPQIFVPVFHRRQA